MYVHCMSYNRRSTGTDSVTGFAQRDHILHFEMCVIQRSIFRQWYANSVSNMGIYRGDGAAAMMKKWSLKDCTIWELWGWVHRICNRQLLQKYDSLKIFKIENFQDKEIQSEWTAIWCYTHEMNVKVESDSHRWRNQGAVRGATVSNWTEDSNNGTTITRQSSRRCSARLGIGSRDGRHGSSLTTNFCITYYAAPNTRACMCQTMWDVTSNNVRGRMFSVSIRRLSMV